MTMAPSDRGNPGQGSGPQPYPGTFLLALREALAGLGWEPVRWLGQAIVCRTAGGEEHTVGLDNLYRRARQEPRDQWPALIAGFLQTVASITPEDVAPDDLASAAGQILPRLGRPFAPSEAKVWSQSLGDTGLMVNLVVDYPDRMTYVSEELITASGQPGEAWLERALANLHERTPADWCRLIDPESGISMPTVGDAYDSSRALILDRLLPESAAGGCFVAPIGRDRTFLLPVSIPGLQYVHLLRILAAKDHPTAPYPISDEVAWVHEGTWRRVSIELSGHEATVTPPPELVEALNRLAGDEGEAGQDTSPE
jgi:hypothetical protein